ncbi:Reverse transcriptase (RNA-dependent DNA polymerase) [Popillia japonica]|uniref:Reverse transcriptase (RNA-dependent DNA polymerase) n=1 Tax=Popillia japonica TaxID=7064 RepID=A0AAW1ISQ0_POPJA
MPYLSTAMIGEVQDIPISKALQDERWSKAMSEEFESLIKMKTWIPISKALQDERWSKAMSEEFESLIKMKTWDLEKVPDFSPVARHVSIRLILSFAASNSMKLTAFDVKTVFLYGDLKEKIYMYQPEGYNDNTGRVCKLNKSSCIYYNQDRSIIIALFVDDGLVVGKNVKDMLEVLNQLGNKFEITFDNSMKDSIS